MPNTEPITPEKLRELACEYAQGECPDCGAMAVFRAAAAELDVMRRALELAATNHPIVISPLMDRGLCEYSAEQYIDQARYLLSQERAEAAARAELEAANPPTGD